MVELQSGAQRSRVLPLLNIHNINASIYQCCHGKWFDIILCAFLLTFIAAGISELYCSCYYWRGEKWRIETEFGGGWLNRMLTKRSMFFYDRPYSTDLPYYVLSPSNTQYIMKKIVVRLSTMWLSWRVVLRGVESCPCWIFILLTASTCHYCCC